MAPAGGVVVGDYEAGLGGDFAFALLACAGGGGGGGRGGGEIIFG